MTLLCADMPEQLEQVKTWLESWLVKPELFDLVAELHAISSPDCIPLSVPELLGRQLKEVMDRGLAPLGQTELAVIIRNPVLLLEMQDLIMEQGGAHWRQILGESSPAEPPMAVRESIAEGERLVGLRWYRRPVLVSFITAVSVAGIMIVVAILQFWPRDNGASPEATAVAWGWAKPGAMPQDLSRAQYFERLAAAADEWSKKNPDTVFSLSLRLHEFRRGCTILQLEKHPPLSAEDKKWLIVRCRVWANQIDRLLARVEADDPKDPIEKIRTEATLTAKNIADEIRDRVNFKSG